MRIYVERMNTVKHWKLLVAVGSAHGYTKIVKNTKHKGFAGPQIKNRKQFAPKTIITIII